MKLHFEPNLDYQLQAIEAVCGLFRGQETCRDVDFDVFADDVAKTNLSAILHQHGLETVRSL